MATPRRDRRPANQFRRAAKIDETALIRLAFCFSHGISVAAAASVAGVSAKTARALYLDFRQRLTMARFNRWHGTYQRLPWAASLDEETLVRVAFLDVLAECYFNTTCWRNYTPGNRKARLCRSCPLPKRFTRAERVDEALTVIDAVHAFYAKLGIKGEIARDPVSLFRLRLIHAASIATAMAASRPLRAATLSVATGLDKAPFLSVWRLLDMLLTDLVDQEM